MVWQRVAFGACILFALLPGTARAAPSSSLPVTFLPVSTPAGCCAGRIVSTTAHGVTMLDSQSGFTATAGPAMVSRGRVHGFIDLWLYVSEHNDRNVTTSFDSGPADWLLGRNADSVYAAYPGVPPRVTGHALAPAPDLQADADPSNDGWIVFHLPDLGLRAFTLEWSDCRPACAERQRGDEYWPVAQLAAPRYHSGHGHGSALHRV